MRSFTKLLFLIALSTIHYSLSTSFTFANAYKGGPGGGSDMAEYTGRLDQSAMWPPAGQAASSTYTGGPGSGSDSAEYVGPLDAKSGSSGQPQCGEPKPRHSWLKRLFSK